MIVARECKGFDYYGALVGLIWRYCESVVTLEPMRVFQSALLAPYLNYLSHAWPAGLVLSIPVMLPKYGNHTV